MFTDSANQYLYIFDTITGTKTGALNTNSTGTIQLQPVAMSQLNFNTTPTSMQDMIWYGAIDTFNTAATSIYNNANQTGLWIFVEYPPTVAVTGQNN
jgi:type IV secretory pathway ATPase VirB11/archaellum biosynthesis ATPase